MAGNQLGLAGREYAAFLDVKVGLDTWGVILAVGMIWIKLWFFDIKLCQKELLFDVFGPGKSCATVRVDLKGKSELDAFVDELVHDYLLNVIKLRLCEGLRFVSL